MDDFVKVHLQSVDGAAKLAQSKFLKTNQTSNVSHGTCPTVSIPETDLSHEVSVIPTKKKKVHISSVKPPRLRKWIGPLSILQKIFIQLLLIHRQMYCVLLVHAETFLQMPINVFFVDALFICWKDAPCQWVMKKDTAREECASHAIKKRGKCSIR